MCSKGSIFCRNAQTERFESELIVQAPELHERQQLLFVSNVWWSLAGGRPIRPRPRKECPKLFCARHGHGNAVQPKRGRCYSPSRCGRCGRCGPCGTGLGGGVALVWRIHAVGSPDGNDGKQGSYDTPSVGVLLDCGASLQPAGTGGDWINPGPEFGELSRVATSSPQPETGNCKLQTEN